MQDNPLVSIICLCYNHEKYVIETLKSVINQSHNNIELIIVDDCSTDFSKNVIVDWLKNYPEIQFVFNDFNLGNTKSFNKALKLAKGEYLIDLAADDVLLPSCVSLQLKGFKNSKFKNTGLVYGNAELISENGSFISYYFPINENGMVLIPRKTGDVYSSILSGGNAICSVTAMIKKEVFDQLGGYDENLAFEDLDLWICASRIYDFDFVDEILLQKRVVTNSLGTDFHKKNDARSKKINFSTYLILKKTLHLNKTKNENKAVLKRVHFEMILNFRNRNFRLLFKYLILEMRFKMDFI